MRRLAVGFGVLAGIVVLWHLVYPVVRVHYRLSIEVETPAGTRSGSGVMALYYGLMPQLWGTSGTSKGLRGEAVVVDLGGHGVMYALLTGRTKDGQPGWPDPASMLTKVMAPEIWQTTLPDRERVSRVGRMAGKREVPAEFIPMLVRFRDERDPRTVEAVDPADLSKSFGPGVKFKRATIEMVSAGWWPLNLFGIGGEPVTRGIEGRLGWLTDPAVIKNPGWAQLPSLTQEVVMGLRHPIK